MDTARNCGISFCKRRNELETEEMNGELHVFSSSSSSSTPSERRLSALVRHLNSPTESSASGVSASITSSDVGSVFSHVALAPEDPILGVISLSPISSFIHLSYCLVSSFPSNLPFCLDVDLDIRQNIRFPSLSPQFLSLLLFHLILCFDVDF